MKQIRTMLHSANLVLVIFITSGTYLSFAKEGKYFDGDNNINLNDGDIPSFVLRGLDIDPIAQAVLSKEVKQFTKASWFGRDNQAQEVKAISDPDVGRKTPELIESRGFICETHFLTTEDGYILGVHRIVNPKLERKTKRPVVLWHGLTGSSVDFINNSPGGSVDEPIIEGLTGNNLGFELAKRGYDVWMSNTRGNIYSRNHTTLNPATDKKYWDFSLDEFIAYDVPAVIDHVQTTTNSSKVGYIGHSQGTAIMFGLLSTQFKYNDIIEPFIALAPVTTVGYSTTPFNSLAKQYWFRKLLLMKGGKFFPDSFMRMVAKRLCAHRTTDFLCQNIIFFMVGGSDSPQLNKTRIDVYAGDAALGTSTKDLVHWAQGISGNTFNHFDYGRDKNRKRYGRPTPPAYPIEHISCESIALFHSLKDAYSDPQDVEILKNRLRVRVMDDYIVPYKEWSHIDFIWGMDAGRFINQRILQLLSKFSD